MKTLHVPYNLRDLPPTQLQKVVVVMKQMEGPHANFTFAEAYTAIVSTAALVLEEVESATLHE